MAFRKGKMKRIGILIIAIAIFLPLASGLSAGLAEGNKRFAISFDPLPLALTAVHLSFQVAFSDVISIPIYYTFISRLFVDDPNFQIFTIGARIFPWKKVHSGFYIGPLVSYNAAAWTWNARRGAFGFGLELGGMLDLGESFFVDLGLGLVRYIIPWEGWIGAFYHSLPAFNFGLGYKF
jgi:hypothetical protein